MVYGFHIPGEDPGCISPDTGVIVLESLSRSTAPTTTGLKDELQNVAFWFLLMMQLAG